MAVVHLGCCVSAHGFGHAARTAAVIEALAERLPLRCTVVGNTPPWFFRSSLIRPFIHRPWQTDVGLVQDSALREDLPATVRELAKFYPLRRQRIAPLARLFSSCDLVLCDIAPLGIAAARQAGVPSVLLENFTWDWLYEGYVGKYPQFGPILPILRDLYAQADYHLQTAPLCRPGPCDLLVGPVSRPLRRSRIEIRRRLGAEEGRPLVLISLGGIGLGNLRLRLPRDNNLYLVAGRGGLVARQANVRRLVQDIGLDHQELVAACDAVIGKVGYSTLAEVYRARIPFGYLRRPGFRESIPLVAFIRKEMAGLEIKEDDLADGGLAEVIPELLARRPPPCRLPDGAGQCAEFLAALCRQHGGRGDADGDGC